MKFTLGSFYKRRHAGTFGNVGAISFNGNKIITTGMGGAILTNDKKIFNHEGSKHKVKFNGYIGNTVTKKNKVSPQCHSNSQKQSKIYVFELFWPIFIIFFFCLTF